MLKILQAVKLIQNKGYFILLNFDKRCPKVKKVRRKQYLERRKALRGNQSMIIRV